MESERLRNLMQHLNPQKSQSVEKCESHWNAMSKNNFTNGYGLGSGLLLQQHSTSSSTHGSKLPMVIEENVSKALDRGDPVVALESTIITHGMPYPANVETARRVEQIIRKEGAIPATIAIIKGIIHVGITNDELEMLGKLKHDEVVKCSRRDIAYICAKKLNGSTTVASTILIANLAGIPVFVTGGIGGVHRGVAETLDISADLTELSRNSTCVVCAGVKSILDIPKTLEFLETVGVTVAAYQSSEFPAFFTSKSGCRAPCTLNNPDEVAKLIEMNIRLNLKSGIVLGVPVPAHEEARTVIVQEATLKALNEASDKKIEGRDITPFLLKRINELTKGESLRANIALIQNNAKIGAQVAVELASLNKKNEKKKNINQITNL